MINTIRSRLPRFVARKATDSGAENRASSAIPSANPATGEDFMCMSVSDKVLFPHNPDRQVTKHFVKCPSFGRWALSSKNSIFRSRWLPVSATIMLVMSFPNRSYRCFTATSKGWVNLAEEQGPSFQPAFTSPVCIFLVYYIIQYCNVIINRT